VSVILALLLGLIGLVLIMAVLRGNTRGLVAPWTN